MTATKSDFEVDPYAPRMMADTDMLEFQTENSRYQVECMKVRRLSGIKDPTPRVGHDWRLALEITYPVVGGNVWIAWAVVGNILQTTMTSTVQSVIETPVN